jgi:hypothetical protein
MLGILFSKANMTIYMGPCRPALADALMLPIAGIGPRIWLPKVIGDFPEAAARQFLEHKLAKHGGGSKLDDAAWRKVFQVGGRPDGMGCALCIGGMIVGCARNNEHAAHARWNNKNTGCVK